MKVTPASLGRAFVVKIENGEILHECIETVARQNNVRHAVCFFLGGADTGSRLIVGPADGQADTIQPMQTSLPNVFEAAAVGTIFPDEFGKPVVHMHATCGRNEDARTGCVRAGVKVWLTGEVVFLELLDCAAQRRRDPKTGFNLLDIPTGPT
jgi:predicted DNA-binding protein with PD1-like motif